jgi:hypothetical protein
MNIEDQNTMTDLQHTIDFSGTMMIGTSFKDYDDAYLKIRKYAFQNGFTIRKGTQRKSPVTKVITRQMYLCSRASKENTNASNKPSGACSCPFRISVNTNDGHTRITSLCLNHNHTLLDPELIGFCAQNRDIPDIIKDKVMELCESHRDFSSNTIFHMLWILYKDECEKSSFTKTDMINFVNRNRRERSDRAISQAHDLYESLMLQQSTEPGLKVYYEFDSKYFVLNEIFDNGVVLDEDRLVNIFWMTEWQVEQFEKFGDVVIFDNTYNTNQYKMPLGYFVGVDHHYKSILLAQCLVRYETSSAFTWIYQRLMDATNNKKLKLYLLMMIQVWLQMHRS